MIRKKTKKVHKNKKASKAQKAIKFNKWFVIAPAGLLVLFLLLPVFDNTVTGGKLKKAAPVVFSENPLSKLFSKAAAVFKGNDASAPANALAMAGGYESQHSAAEGVEDILAAMAYQNESYTDENGNVYSIIRDESGAPIAVTPVAAEALAEEDNWVLVRQAQPVIAVKGAYEASSKDYSKAAIDKQRKNQSLLAGRGQYSPKDLQDIKNAVAEYETRVAAAKAASASRPAKGGGAAASFGGSSPFGGAGRGTFSFGSLSPAAQAAFTTSSPVSDEVFYSAVEDVYSRLESAKGDFSKISDELKEKFAREHATEVKKEIERVEKNVVHIREEAGKIYAEKLNSFKGEKDPTFKPSELFSTCSSTCRPEQQQTNARISATEIARTTFEGFDKFNDERKKQVVDFIMDPSKFDAKYDQDFFKFKITSVMSVDKNDTGDTVLTEIISKEENKNKKIYFVSDPGTFVEYQLPLIKSSFAVNDKFLPKEQLGTSSIPIDGINSLDALYISDDAINEYAAYYKKAEEDRDYSKKLLTDSTYIRDKLISQGVNPLYIIMAKPEDLVSENGYENARKMGEAQISAAKTVIDNTGEKNKLSTLQMATFGPVEKTVEKQGAKKP